MHSVPTSTATRQDRAGSDERGSAHATPDDIRATSIMRVIAFIMRQPADEVRGFGPASVVRQHASERAFRVNGAYAGVWLRRGGRAKDTMSAPVRSWSSR